MEYLDSSNRLVLAPEPRWFLSPKRIRALIDGVAVVDSTNARLLREIGPPVYYFPIEDVRTDVLEPSTTRRDIPGKGEAAYHHMRVDDRLEEDAAWTFDAPDPDAGFLKGYVALRWAAMDGWFEEDDEVFVHPRDPFKRIEALQTSKRIEVRVGGEIVADSRRAVVLLEPGHPIRYYFPKTDVRLDLLSSSPTSSRCAYKGEANYYSVGAVEDAAWSYRYPAAEVARVGGMVCFFNERVDEIVIDGEQMEKPSTAWRR